MNPITDIRCYPLSEWRSMLLVVVETADGTTGLGEAGLTAREYAVMGMIEDLKSLLIGQDAGRIEHLWQTMWRSGFHPSGQVLSSAIAAIDIALWDIKGKRLGVPVYDLLGGKTRDKVLTYCHIGGATIEETLDAARARVAEGWKAIRWEPGYKPDHILRPAQAVEKVIAEFALLRRELGPDIELALDAHTKLNSSEAVYLCDKISEFRPMFVEDPIRCESVNALRDVRMRTNVPLAAGEQLASKWQYGQLINDRLIDYVRFDACIGGGITEGRKIAALAETQMIDLAVHNPIGPVSTAACLHLNMASPNVLVQELPRRPGESLPDLVTTDQTWDDGWLSCTGAPGLGIEFHPEHLEQHPFTHTQLPQLTREDGSFTNW